MADHAEDEDLRAGESQDFFTFTHFGLERVSTLDTFQQP